MILGKQMVIVQMAKRFSLNNHAFEYDAVKPRMN
jgi:hypothetical protein